MWDLPEQAVAHVLNPRNAGALDGADAVGEAGSLAAGDTLRLMLKVDPGTGVIREARFLSQGCGAAIAASSALTELLVGRTVGEAANLGPGDIDAALGGLPATRRHAQALGAEALARALAAYEGETPEPVCAGRRTLVCRCNGIDAGTIERTIRTHGLTSLREVTARTGAGDTCTSCREPLEELLAATNAQMVQDGQIGARDAFVFPDSPPRTSGVKVRIVPQGQSRTRTARAPAPAPVAPPPVAKWPKDGEPSPVRDAILITRLIEAARPQFQADGGDVELVDYVDGTGFVVLSGACATCSAAVLTLGGLRQTLEAALGHPVRLQPAPAHGRGRR